MMAGGAGRDGLGAGWREPDPAPAWPLAPTPASTPSLSLASESLQPLQDLTGDGGVRKEQLRPGTGQPVPPSASVAVKYSGYLGNWNKLFCSNGNSKYPRLMKLGKDITLWGLEIGLLSMTKGEAALFVLAPEYAYGQRGCPPSIPPNTTVLFKVEVLDFIDSEECDAFFELTYEQRDRLPLEKVLKVAATEREFGNYFFYKQRFKIAKDRYKRALSILGRSSSSKAEQSQINASKLLLFLNLSLTYLKLERADRALKYGELALEMDQGNAKALFRCGQACLYMREYSKSRDFLARAQCIQPFNRDINKELKKLARYYKEYMEMEKEMCCQMFDPLNSYG
ncbi:inactive peptidyl-prolyl cis-trans isomerase FKBP6 [Onychostruthus taczanowskii]|uniref:inactive peptidyl-prolyl cis-trans isomerase FKBP6 n=1 Tax=Onychostruthus taczanowskii TaxID=356909 RepID=UPI001B807FFF|nr:inactive peptidyl-prolyl cis-trans isomerase FKBP6 [Onychostruthus taczanowskii]